MISKLVVGQFDTAEHSNSATHSVIFSGGNDLRFGHEFALRLPLGFSAFGLWFSLSNGFGFS